MYFNVSRLKYSSICFLLIVIVPFPFAQSDPQKMGSAITYAKRYLLTTVFNVIAEEDDDGNAASGNTTKPVAKKKPTVMTDAPKPTFFN